MSSIATILQLKTPSPLSNIVYTLLCVALTIILLVVIPHSIYEDIEKQAINPADLSIGPELNVYFDQDADISVETILQRTPDLTQAFLGHTWLKPRLSSVPVWLTFPIVWQPDHSTSESMMALFIDMGFATLSDVRMLVVDPSGDVIHEQRSGDHILENQRPIPISHPIFNFTVQPGKPYFVVMRIDSDSFLNTSIAVSSGKQAILSTHHLGFLLGLFYGCLGMIFFYNVFILILTRRVSYLYYVLYLFFLFCYQGINDGVIGQYLWSQPGWFLDRSLVFFAGLANLMALLFVRTILQLNRYAPKLNKWVGKFILFISFSFVVELVYPSSFSSLWMLVTVLAFCLLLPILGGVAWKRGSLLARSYFVAWMSYPILVGVYVLCMAGIVPTSYDTLNSIRVGSTIQAVLMSFALAYYISQLRLQKFSLKSALYEELETQIDQMSQTTRALSQGDFDVRSHISSDARLGSLSMDVNSLADDLEEANSQRQRWMADISHELRTPLTIFRGTLESMQLGIMPINKESLQNLIDESGRLNRLVDELHDLSLLESKEMRFNPEMIDVVSIIKKVLAGYREGLNDKSISVAITYEEPSLWVYVDRDRITQVFVNLMTNSIKYTHSPGTLAINIKRVRNTISIEWSDSEPGVPEKEITNLFSRLYRSDPSRNRHTGGAGLGLALSRAIILHAGGSVEAQPSNLGGMQINIILPSA